MHFIHFLFCLIGQTLGSSTRFFRTTPKLHRRYFQNVLNRDIYTNHKPATTEAHKNMDRLRNRMYRRELQAMIDNLTIGPGGHAKRHSLDEFKKSAPFTPAPSRAQIKAKRFRLYHLGNWKFLLFRSSFRLGPPFQDPRGNFLALNSI